VLGAILDPGLCQIVLYRRQTALRKLFLLSIVLTLLVSFVPGAAEAGKTIVSVQTVRAKPYDEAFNGFRTGIGEDATVHRVILDDIRNGDAVEAICEFSPDLVFAIGMHALSHAVEIKDIPVVYAMVMDAAGSPGQADAAGVKMEINPETQLAILLEAFPRTRTIGLLYDPERSGALVRNIRTAANEKGITLIANEVYRSKNVPPAGMEMMGKIDLFWMLPDLTVITPENIEFLFLFAMEARIPVLAFSEKYLKLGASLAIGVDPFDMGCQAAEKAKKMLEGTDAASVPDENARKTIISINPRIARKLGIVFRETFLERVRIIE